MGMSPRAGRTTLPLPTSRRVPR